MEITDVKLKRIDSEGLKAVCSVNFENLFVVHGIRLIEGKEGMFLSFPARIRSDNSFLDVAHPIDSGFRTKLTNAIADEYKKSNTVK